MQEKLSEIRRRAVWIATFGDNTMQAQLVPKFLDSAVEFGEFVA